MRRLVHTPLLLRCLAYSLLFHAASMLVLYLYAPLFAPARGAIVSPSSGPPEIAPCASPLFHEIVVVRAHGQSTPIAIPESSSIDIPPSDSLHAHVSPLSIDQMPSLADLPLPKTLPLFTQGHPCTPDLPLALAIDPSRCDFTLPHITVREEGDSALTDARETYSTVVAVLDQSLTKEVLEEALPLSLSRPPTIEVAPPRLPSNKDIVGTNHLATIPKEALLPTSSVQDTLLFVRTLDIRQHALPAFQERWCWDQYFDIATKAMSIEEGGKTFFTLTLRPNIDMAPHTLKQNFYFLIDTPQAMARERFPIYLRGVEQALAYLVQGQSFNIFFLDGKISRLSPTLLPVNRRSMQLAEHFLHHHSFKGKGIAKGDTLSTFLTELASSATEEELHTIILLTEGRSFFDRRGHSFFVHNASAYNRNKFILYAAAIGDAKKEPLLDMLCTVSGGSLISSPTHAAFRRKFAKFFLDHRYPIIKNVAVKTHTDQGCVSIDTTCLPPFYAGHPYTITGIADKTERFTCVIEGERREGLVSIPTSLTLENTQRHHRTLFAQWQTARAYAAFGKFLEGGKTTDLREAVDLFQKKPIASISSDKQSRAFEGTGN